MQARALRLGKIDRTSAGGEVVTTIAKDAEAGDVIVGTGGF